LCHTAYFILKLIDHAAFEEDSTGSSQLYHSTIILASIILPTMVVKFMHFNKIYSELGRLSELLFQSFTKVGSFMFIFLLWTILFAMEYFILQSNLDDAAGYSGTSQSMGYFIVAFQNGIGGIVPPTVDAWNPKDDQIFSEKVLIFLVYFFWLFQQYVVLIVLLNFLVAMISSVYEEVMDAKLQYEFKQKSDLNGEADRFFKFIDSFRSGTESHVVDQVIVINGIDEASEEDKTVQAIQSVKDFFREKVVEKMDVMMAC
jgi:hypothetical protein